VVEVLLMVPWVVLSELDLLKHSERKAQAAAARNALHRLRALTARRDTCVRLQPAAEHQQVGGGGAERCTGGQLGAAGSW
jgi:predicted ribonuclease YlaK